jgi:hypothetical protein
MILRGCNCNLSGLGAGGSVVSGQSCPDGSYLNVFQVQQGMQCPPVVTQSAPSAPAPIASASPMAPASPTTTVNAPPQPVLTPFVSAQRPGENTSTRFELIKQTASGGGSDLKPIGDESSVTPVMMETTAPAVAQSKPWWLILLAGAVFLTN